MTLSDSHAKRALDKRIRIRICLWTSDAKICQTFCLHYSPFAIDLKIFKINSFEDSLIGFASEAKR